MEITRNPGASFPDCVPLHQATKFIMTDKINGAWLFSTLAAAAVLTVTMGARQSLGLFIFPLNNSTGLGLVTISFALAVGQFVWARYSRLRVPPQIASVRRVCWSAACLSLPWVARSRRL